MSPVGAHPSVTVAPVCLDNDLQSSSALSPRQMGLILSIVSGLIVSANLLVAAAVLKLLLRKRSQSWCFVLNLALADFLVGVAITGVAIEDFSVDGDAQKLCELVADDPSAQASPPGEKRHCLMRMTFVMSPSTASIMSMFFISLDRYAAIKMPLRYSRLSGKATAAASLLALWISSLLVGFLPVLVPPLQTESYGGFCSLFAVVRKVCMVVFSMCFFPLFSVFVYIYLDILKIAWGHHKQIGRIRRACSRRDHQRGQHPQQPRSRFWAHAKALRTVAVLVGCVSLLWCPFFVVGMVELLCSSCRLSDVVQNHLWLLGLSNSLVNPLVYAFWQKELRSELALMFSCCACRMAAAGPPSAAERRNLPSVVTVPVCDTPNSGRFFGPDSEQGRGAGGATARREKQQQTE